MKEKVYIHDGEPITQEQIQEIEEAKKLPITYDEDSPKLDLDNLVFRRKPSL